MAFTFVVTTGASMGAIFTQTVGPTVVHCDIVVGADGLGCVGGERCGCDGGVT